MNLMISSKPAQRKKWFNWQIFVCSHSLKIIAICAMIIDHLGYFTFHDQLWMRHVGRISFPLFAFLIGYGFHKSYNVINYTLRIVVMFFVIQIPQTWFLMSRDDLHLNQFYINIFFNLSLAAITILIWKFNYKWGLLLFLLIIISFVFLILFPLQIGINTVYKLEIDYGLYGYLLIVMSYMVPQLVQYTKTKGWWHYHINGTKKVVWIIMFITLLLLDYYFISKPPRQAWYALFSALGVIGFVDINLRLKKYLQYLLYFIYPVSTLLIIGFSN